MISGAARRAARRGSFTVACDISSTAYFHLVFEASRERRTLLRIAPHLVRPLRFTWPVYQGARVPGWKLGAGLMLYDALALWRNVARHRRLTARRVLDPRA